MLIWTAWRWVRGVVTFRAEGGLCERFFSLLGEGDTPIALWDIHRHDGAIVANCRAADYGRLRAAARRTGTRVHSLRHVGLPFAARPLTRRLGILFGAAAAVALCMILGSRIWIVDVQTDDPVLVARIERVLADSGVTLGARMNDIDIETVQMHAIAQIQEINQLSLYFDGSIARVGVQLQKDSATPPVCDPANVVAAADGRILSIRATVGQPLVQAGEAVVKGDLLVCGAIDTGKGTLLRRADAEILAETTHILEQTVSRSELLEQEGRMIEQPSLYILSWKLPLYSRAAFNDSWTVQTIRRPVTLFGTALPIGIESDLYTEHIHTSVTHTVEEAEQLAKERLQAQADERLAAATVTDVQYDGVWEGDVYRLRATYSCVEDIAVQVPLMIVPPQ